MEENLEILNHFKITKPKAIKYYAEFNVETGAIQKVGPDHAFKDVKNKILIPEDVAINILNGIIKMTTCYVDVIENKFYQSEIRNVVKIDDLLHRIVEKKHHLSDNPHILLTYDKNKKTIEITKFFLKKGIMWDGDTLLNFYITAFNDPTIIYETVSVYANDLSETPQKIFLENLQDDDFSIFTRRMFQEYVLVKK